MILFILKMSIFDMIGIEQKWLLDALVSHKDHNGEPHFWNWIICIARGFLTHFCNFSFPISYSKLWFRLSCSRKYQKVICNIQNNYSFVVMVTSQKASDLHSNYICKNDWYKDQVPRRKYYAFLIKYFIHQKSRPTSLSPTVCFRIKGLSQRNNGGEVV